MIDKVSSPDIQSLLGSATAVICEQLKHLLPAINPNWWECCVSRKLSFQQREHIERRRISTLDELDLAAFLRIIDQNWFDLADRHNWPNEGRNFLKELQTVRNRWAHAGALSPKQEDVYRDVDTLHRFLQVLCPKETLVAELEDLKRDFLQTKQATVHVSPEPSVIMPSSEFCPGMLVAMRSDPTIQGVITAVISGQPESRLQVFCDNKVATFYESQVIPVTPQGEQHQVITFADFNARLTALQLLRPSVSNLYSLHAARIEVIPYQFRPVLKLIQADRPRLLIADSVGVGKTIEAGLILRELQARREIRRVLIICPRPLVTERKWQREMKRFDEHFEHLDGPKLQFCLSETVLDGEWPQQYSKAILPYSLMDDALLHGKGRRKGLLALDPPPQFDLVIVDEAHHIRNASTERYKAVRFLCDHAEAVVFLTATPIQLGQKDLFTLLNILRPDLIIDQASYAAITEPNTFINRAAICARSGNGDWVKAARDSLENAANTNWGLAVLRDNPRFQEVFDQLTDSAMDLNARVGVTRAIEGLHTLSCLMNRTLRRDIGEFTRRKPETVLVPFTPAQQALHDSMLKAQAAIYAALHGDKHVNFLLTTIRRQAASCIHGLAPLLQDILTRRLSELDCDAVDEEYEDECKQGTIPSVIERLIEDALQLANELPQGDEADPKLKAVIRILLDKACLPNNKVMIFSSYRHTLAYIYEALLRAGFRVGMIHGGIEDETRVELRTRFELKRDIPDAIDVLLFSEVGCEGLDYQFCDCLINYDLPWNPMRIDQRIGRIDRWGQTSEAVAIYNLITPGTVDADIYERCLERIGVFQHALGANEDILGEITQKISAVADNLMLSPEERREKLETIARNSIGMIKEQQDLEAGQTSLFGIQVPAEQYRQDVASATSYWLSPASLERLVSLYLCMRAGKSESLLAGAIPVKTMRVDRDTREALLADFKQLAKRDGTLAREWEAWLKGSESNLKVTFDPAAATTDRTACLITPVHPFAVQAAHALGACEKSNVPLTGICVTSNSLPPGEYPFSIYEWQYIGIRNDVEFKPVTTSAQITDTFFALMPDAEGLDISSDRITTTVLEDIETQHYKRWSDARAQHMENTERLAEFRQVSLDTSHKARLTLLDAQVKEATNEKIRIMKTAQKTNAEADYQRRCGEISAARAKADIKFNLIAHGIIQVRRP